MVETSWRPRPSPRALIVSLVVSVLIAFTSTVSPSTALFKASCRSFSLLPGTTTNTHGNLTSFSTFNGFGVEPFHLTDSATGRRVFSGEAAPVDGEPGRYVANYIVENLASNAITEVGAIVWQLPRGDLDGNGLPDILELEKLGSADITGFWYGGMLDPQDGELTGFIERHAGEAAGRYQFCFSNEIGSTTVTGILRLAVLTGPVAFTRGGSGFLCVTSAWTDLYGTQTVSGACLQEHDSFSVEGIDFMRFDPVSFGRTEVNRGLALGPFYLGRDGTSYRAQEIAGDVLETWWEDYPRWTVELIAAEDSDTNGVPDLSDFVPGFPYLRQQPPDLRVVTGANVPLSVNVGGAEPLSYQWSFNSAVLTGAIERVLVLTNVTTNHAGYYSVAVSNAAGRTVSRTFTLTLVPPFVGPVELDWIRYFVPENKLAVDSRGHLVAGGTCRLTSAGVSLWAISFPARDFALDSEDAVYVTGSNSSTNGDYDIQTAKFDATGSLVWSNRYDFAGRTDQPVAIATDALGNAYVAGNVEDSNGRLNYALIKYSAGGQEQWRRQHLPDCNDHGVTGLAVSRAGEAYVAGWGATLKYDANGSVLWMEACTNYWTLRLKLDAAGNLLSGVSWLGNGCGVVKHLPNGEWAWSVRKTNNLQFADLAVDASNHVYLADSGGHIAQYNPAGAAQWTANNPGVPDSAISMVLALDREGAIHSTGTIRDNTSTRDSDLFTQKWNPQGARVWSTRYLNPDSDVGHSMAFDADGAVYVGAVLSRTFPVVLRYWQPPPGASIQPPRQTVAAGATAAFNAFYRGSTGSLAYQWRLQGNNIVGATGATLVVEGTTPAHTGEYSVTITDGLGQQTTATAALTVLPLRAAQVRFSAGYFVPDESVGIALEADPGAYCIEISNDLLHWRKFTLVEGHAGVVAIPTAGLPRLFVRALRLP